MPTFPYLYKTRTLFLRTVSLCYCTAFLSLYVQIPGLYGPTGLLPAKSFIDHNLRGGGDGPHLNLLLALPAPLGLSVDLTMDLVCLFGAVLSLLMTLLPSWNKKVGFVLLWVSYRSLYSVGQTFLWFQWDILLLEVGFLCVIVAPLYREHRFTRPWDRVNLCLIRWLLFRMMFASGVVKLLSNCPAWWGLTALPLHYESQCLPTWLAWYAHNLVPDTFHRLSVVGTYVIEIPMTFLFIAPTKGLRKVTFWLQVMLMLNIMLTGNYNFFNFLYIALCFSLMDDSWLEKRHHQDSSSSSSPWPARLFNLLVISFLVYMIAHYFVSFNSSVSNVELLVKFSKSEFRHFVDVAGTASVSVGLAFFGLSALSSSAEALFSPTRKLYNFVVTLSYVGIGFVMVCISVPGYLQGMSIRDVPAIIPTSLTSDPFDLAHSYGLFRSMTGIGGRPEIVIEGTSSESGQGPWIEYSFAYKPGRLDDAPKFLLPHQPRLDWQMWFAALGSYQHNPWLLSLLYRLLKNDPSVVDLLDGNPFGGKSPPKLVRAKLYHYHFTEDGGEDVTDYWRREFQREYLPAVDAASLAEVLSRAHILGEDGRNVMDVSSNKTLEKWLKALRRAVKNVRHHTLVQSVMLLAFPILWSL